ncbi:TetR/AcrR family transcriptional regulator [Pseudovibrio sp. Tun.PSC04-5.I4]|uniref:TetR/AcrR family transcriptional regulator n=1 Tax=Pseudovibrio sp. Tun.PSC04-5.I4 TaxID=1798213 RepID=UPI0008896CC6|nr:TetR/AcrR family transcriptional regulator [Pseudovibrio sp. Tun.PSC04-5.I4]SDQ21938.1 DNA-binding transcriptional regulator, AcrR family [Pseudovibrio sp. Tun.PSC04-5.I4]
MVSLEKKKTQAERREESERKLLDALVTIINEDGIQSATCESIGLKAGYSRGLTIQRLGKKDEMFIKLIDRMMMENKLHLAEEIPQDTKGHIALHRYINIHFDDLQNKPIYQAYFALVAGSVANVALLGDALKQAHDFIKHMLMSYLDRGKAAGEFPQDLDSAIQAVSIGSYLLGVALQQKLHPSLDINLLKPAAYSLIPSAPD